MRRRIKVVHLTEDLAIGGQEKIIAVLAPGLDRERFEVEVWCLARGGVMADEVARAGIRVRVLDLTGYHNPLNILRLAARLRGFGADIVHTHGDFAGTFGRLAAVMARTHGVVAHVHTRQPGLRPRHLRVQRLLACITARVVCVSRSVREFVTTEVGIPGAKACVIRNGIPSLAACSCNRDGVEEDAPGDLTAVSVGALVENKGHRLLIDAFREAVSARPGLKLLIVGDGPLRGELENRVAELNLGARVELTGRVLDVHPLLARAAMFILPTIHREGLPVSVLEACRCGVPVIASDLGGVREAVEHRRSGLLVRPGDAAALSAAIRELAGDPRLRRSLGAAGRVRFEKEFCAERMVTQVERLYASICREEPLAA